MNTAEASTLRSRTSLKSAQLNERMVLSVAEILT
jgi:hypothetical protein